MRNQAALSRDGKHYVYDATIGPLSPVEMEPMVRILVGSSLPVGPTPEPRIGLARHVADGGLDPTFGNAGKALTPLPPGFTGTPANASVLATCSVVVVGGWFDEGAGGVPKIGVVRYRR